MNGLHEGNVLSLDESVQDLVESIQNPKKLKFTVPQTLHAVMREYQVYGFEWMKNTCLLPFWRYFSRRYGTWKNAAKYCLYRFCFA